MSAMLIPLCILGWGAVAILVAVLLWQRRHAATASTQGGSAAANGLCLSIAAETAPDGFLVLEEDGKILDANRVALRFLGAPLDRVRGRPLSQVLPGVDVAGAAAPGSLQEVPCAGSWLQVSLASCESRAGRAPRLVLSLRDITAQKQLEERLRRFEFMVENAGTECYLVRLDGSFEYVNRAAAASLGYTVPELLALGVTGVDPLTGTHFQQHVEALRQGDLPPFETVHTAKDGHPVPKELKSVLLRLGGGDYVCGFGNAIGARKRAEGDRLELERRVRQTERLESLAALAGGVAHDFSNALTAVLGNLEMATEELPTGESSARVSIDEAIAAGRRAVILTRQMLAFSGRSRLHLAALDLNAFLDSAASRLRMLLPAQVTLTLQADPGLPTVLADAAQLQQALVNLVSNAGEAMGEGPGAIVVSAAVRPFDATALQGCPSSHRPTAGNFVVFEVADGGPGMDAATQDHLFEPFFTTKRGARGLGLPMVLGIANGLHGAVLVDSASGKGTKVRLLIPVPQAVPAAPPAGARPKASAKTRPQAIGTVLVVDDEPSVRSLAARMVERMGFTVVTAADGLEAVEQFRRHDGDIACVLLDLIMPRLDGVAAFAALRDIRPDVKIILCSGFNDPEATQRLIVEGANGFLQKPFVYNQLQDALSRAVGTPKAPVA
jgi:PAS domain S-box-containing protein